MACESSRALALIAGTSDFGDDYDGLVARARENEAHEGSLLHHEEIAMGDASSGGWVAVLRDGTIATGGGAPKIAFGASRDKSSSCASVGSTHCCVVGMDGEWMACRDLDDNAKVILAERPAWIPKGAAIVEVACGRDFTVARTSRLEVYTWGTNSRGLGRGPRPGKSGLLNAVLVPGLIGAPISRIAAGESHACAVGLSGSCFAWGENDDGRCGVRVRRVLWQPEPVDSVLQSGERFADVACGAQHTVFALSPSSRVVGLSSGETTELMTGRAVAVSAFGNVSAVLLEDGSINRFETPGAWLNVPPEAVLRATFCRHDDPAPVDSIDRLLQTVQSPSLLAGSFLCSPRDSEDDEDHDDESVVKDEAAVDGDEECDAETAERRIEWNVSLEAGCTEDAGTFTDEESDTSQTRVATAFSIDDDDDEDTMPELIDMADRPTRSQDSGRRWKGLQRLDVCALEAALNMVTPDAKRKVARACRRGAGRLRAAIGNKKRLSDDDVGRCVAALWAVTSTFWPPDLRSNHIAVKPLRLAAIEVLDLVALRLGRCRSVAATFRVSATDRAAAFAVGANRDFRRRLARPALALFAEAATAIRRRHALPCGQNGFVLGAALDDTEYVVAEEVDDFDEEDSAAETSSSSSSSDDFEEEESVARSAFGAARRAAIALAALRAHAATRGATRAELCRDYLCEAVDRLGALVDMPNGDPRPGALLADFSDWRRKRRCNDDAPSTNRPFSDDDDDAEWHLASFAFAYSAETRRALFSVEERRRRETTAARARAQLFADSAADAGLAWISPFFALLAASRDAPPNDAFADDGDVVQRRRERSDETRDVLREMMVAMTGGGEPTPIGRPHLPTQEQLQQQHHHHQQQQPSLLRRAMQRQQRPLGREGRLHQHEDEEDDEEAEDDAIALDDDEDDDGGGFPSSAPPPTSGTATPVAAPYFVVRSCRGERMAHDALLALGRASDDDLCRREMRVAFDGEPGVDEGGVKKEFFELVAPQLFDPTFSMFVTCQNDDLDAHLYFNPLCTWYLAEYEQVGIFCGLAFANGIVLPAARLATVAFKKLLAWRAARRRQAQHTTDDDDNEEDELTRSPLAELLEDLEEVDRPLSRGLRHLLSFEPRERIEEVYQRAFVYGEPPKPLLEGGEDMPVTHINRRRFVRLVATHVLHRAVRPQFRKFAEGFWRTAAKEAFVDILQPEDFRDCCRGVCQEADLDWNALRAVTRYDGWPSDDPDAAHHPVITAFWTTVLELDPRASENLLKFVTGSKTPPIGGLGNLKPPTHAPFRIQRMGCDSNFLPTAHVCFNTLLLPDYDPPAKLRPLLQRAISECEGFGLR